MKLSTLFYVFATICLLAPVPAIAASKPNIVILYADDMGYGDLAIQNPNSKIPTPNLDKLAREGLRLTDAHSSSGICTPSRYALLTGRYHWRKFHNIVQSFGPSSFDKERLTLPEMLQEQGYYTACIGKWHLGWDWDAIKKKGARPQGNGKRKAYAATDFDWSKPIPGGPLDHGFDYYFGDDVPNFPPYTWIENDKVVETPTIPYAPDPLPTEGAPEGRPGPSVAGWQQDQVMPTLTKKVVEFLGKQKDADKPFFLYFPWTSPHAPIVPVEANQGKTQAGGYGDFMHQSDLQAGQVLSALKANGLEENTIVIFTSDNGPEKYAYDRVQKSKHRSMGPLRGLKRDIYEGGHRVPMIIRWPGKIKAGRVSDALISQVDIFATLAAVTGFDIPADAADDSLNQLPLLKDEKHSSNIRTATVHNTRAKHFAIRENDWLLIDSRTGSISGEPQWFMQENGYQRERLPAQLFNLRDDLSQKKNLLVEYPGKAAALRMRLAAIQKHGQRKSETGLYTAQGIMTGELTAGSALVQVRLTSTTGPVKGDVPGAAGKVYFKLQSMDKEQQTLTAEVEAKAANDFIARASFTGLKPGTLYMCTTEIAGEERQPGPTASFKTLPGPSMSKPVRFVVVTGMNYAKFHGDDRIDLKQHAIENNTELPAPYSGPDKHLGYPGLASILKVKPDFFIGTGDNVYYDTPDNPRAATQKEMRQKWHEQFVQPRYVDLFAEVPTYWEIDDHDYRIDDGDNSGDYPPTPALARKMVHEQLPIAPAGAKDAKTYRTHRVSKDLQLWFVENRFYRSPNAAPDGPSKTIWGFEQREWLKRTLKASDATFKLLISPTPMIGPDDLRKIDNHTNFNGFRHERDDFFKFLKDSGVLKKNFFIVCGDRHWQYHSVNPDGVEEFSCGALVDANSRLGRKPGDKASTDPKGLINQVYAQKERSAGFLLVQVLPGEGKDRPAQLSFIWHDEFGKVLHRHDRAKDAPPQTLLKPEDAAPGSVEPKKGGKE